MPKVFVLNGVNLGALGERRPEVYGAQTLRDIEELLRGEFADIELEFRHTDYEGEFIAWIRESAGSDGLVVNPGALETLSVPRVEVHLSNIHAREEAWRRVSVVSPAFDATVAGMGFSGYVAAVRYVLGR